MLARDPNAYVIRAAGPCPTRPAMPNHVTNTTCTASQANGESRAPLLPIGRRAEQRVSRRDELRDGVQDRVVVVDEGRVRERRRHGSEQV